MKHAFLKPAHSSVAGTCGNIAFWFLTLLYMETVLHLLLFKSFNVQFLYAIGFTAAIAVGISGLLSFLRLKANRIISVTLVTVLSILYCSQLVYNAIFGTMYSISLMGMGGAALTNFWRETLRTILDMAPSLLVMLIPVPVTVVFARKVPSAFDFGFYWYRFLVLIMAVAIHFGVYCSLSIGGTAFFSAHYMYHSSDTTTDHAAERFGLLTTLRLEMASGEPSQEENGFELLPETITPETQAPSQDVENTHATEDAENTGDTENTETTEATEAVVEYNILNIDFDYLNTLTEDNRLIELNNYVKSLPPTNKNEYTGMLADYNLITICAESFSTAAIDPILTPTLYKLSTEGFVFNNFYNSYPNVTTDGEYSFCFGIWPDTSRGKNASSFQVSQDNYLPFALGNIFRRQAGINSYAYHNYKGSYYGREQSHPNMGYDCKFMHDGMTFTTAWPSSDLEMMEQSVADYIRGDQQFHAYYMTFSGHYRYDKENPMASRNYDMVKELDYSEAVKCYLSCNYELEKALSYLMAELEKAGVADKTAIVLVGDHFPYGLSDQQYSELIGYEIDKFTKFKSTLIFWVGGMEEPVYVDEYMCNNDILPTILNLWGFEYDSRLLAGTDVFSDGEHIAVLRNQSFFNDTLWFDSSTGNIIWQGEEQDPAIVDTLIRKIKNQFNLSEKILNMDYYRYIAEHCESMQYE